MNTPLKTHVTALLVFLSACGTTTRENENPVSLQPLNHSAGGVTHVMPIGDSLMVGWIDWGISSAGYRENLYKALNRGFTPPAYDFVGYYNGIKTRDASVSGTINSIDNHNEARNGDRINDMIDRTTAAISLAEATASRWDDTAVNQEDPSLLSSCSQAGKSRLQCYLPDIVLLMAGSNDMPKDDHWSAEERLDEFIRLIYKHSPATKIYVASLPPTGLFFINQRISSYNAKVEHLVNTRKAGGDNIAFVPIHRAVTTRDLYKDQAHYTRVGYCKMANKWIEYMSEITTKNYFACR